MAGNYALHKYDSCVELKYYQDTFHKAYFAMDFLSRQAEKENDLQLFDEALERHRKMPVTYSHDEVCNMFD